ncbi:ROK family protein [Streptomyces sp. NPDC004031]
MTGRPAPADGAPVPVLEIGGTHVTAALVDPARGSVLGGSVRHAALGPADPADRLLTALTECARGLDAPRAARWGVAVPGPFDYARGIARFSGVGKFDSLNGIDLGQVLAAALGGTAGDFRFLNDAHAFALGEWAAGAARGHDRTVGLTLGTGVGSAFLASGRLVDTGPEVPPGGYLHLLSVGGHPLEDTVSRRAILRRYAAERGGPQPGVDVRDVAERARAGEGAASRTMRQTFQALGAATAPWLAAFRAGALVVGGSIAGAWDLVEPALRDGMARAVPGTGIVPRRAAHPAEAPLLGAALHARQPCASRVGPRNG